MGQASIFLDKLLLVAQELGIILADHPDDLPLAYVRYQPCFVYIEYLSEINR